MKDGIRVPFTDTFKNPTELYSKAACPAFVPTVPKGGMKYDAGKLLFGCLTRGLADSLKAVAEVLTYGAKKYERNSWQTVPNATERYEDALQRHLNAWSAGISHDDESHLLHLAHVATNALFLLHFELEKHGKDK